MSDFEVTTSLDDVLKNVTETLRNYFIVNHSKSLDEVSTVITVMVNNLKTLVASNEPTQAVIEQLEEALKKHYKQKKVMISERYKFFKRDQVNDESITSYVNDLKNLATTCLFGVFLEEALRDKLVCGMKDKNIQADLLTKEDLTFDYAYQYASTMEKLALESKLLEAEKIDIKEEPNPLEFQELFEAQQKIYDIKCESRDNLQVEPIGKSCERDKQFTEKLISKNRITCKFCGKTFTRNYGLEKHLKVHASLKPFLCETCNDSFSSKESLRQHVQGHTTDDISYTCQNCNKQFAKKSKLARHLRTHDEKKKFLCEFCNKTFTRKYNLKHHLKSHADIPSWESDPSPEITRLFKCGTCNFTTKTKDSLRRHIYLHKGEKPFLCNFCDYKTARNSRLQVHLRKHTGVKPYKCELCDFKAASQSNLRNHKLIHSQEKLLVCEFCGYKTNYSTLLRTHLRTHTGEKPYACKICDYKSSDRSTLRNHLRTHTGEKPYSCKFCDYRAAQRTGLVYHLKTHKK